jgi:HEAT repeat protein
MAQINYDMGYRGLDWMALYGVAPNAACKARLIETGFSSLTLGEKEQLADGEKSELLLMRMIPRINGIDYLLAMSNNSDSRLAAAALSAMGTATKTPQSVDKLLSVWEHGTNDVLRRAALNSILTLTEDEPIADEALLTDSFDDGFRVSALQWLSDHDPDKARERALSALAGSASEPMKIASIRVLGKVKDKPGERRAYAAIAVLMAERSNGPLRAAISALGEYGDKSAIPLLESRADHSLHFVRRDVAAALAKLNAK